MKTWKIFWGLGLILVAVLLLLNSFGVVTPMLEVVGGISIMQMVCGLFLLEFIISRVIKLKFTYILLPISLLFMVFERNIAVILKSESENLINNWWLFGCALLISIGIEIILPKGKKFRANKKVSGEKVNGNNIGSGVLYIDCRDFVERKVWNRMGEFTVHFENTDQFTSGAILSFHNKLGEITVYVPSNWNVREDIDNNLGGVSYSGNGDVNGPTLVITGDNALGEISIKYV